jgi:hypothetical protein
MPLAALAAAQTTVTRSGGTGNEVPARATRLTATPRYAGAGARTRQRREVQRVLGGHVDRSLVGVGGDDVGQLGCLTEDVEERGVVHRERSGGWHGARSRYGGVGGHR